MEIQSIRLSKKNFKTYEQAERKAKLMGYKTKVKPNPQYLNWWAFRQLNPELFHKNSFRNHKISDNMYLIIGKLKEKN